MQNNGQNLNRFYLALVTIVFLGLIFRLVQLQLYNREKYYTESERNRIRDVIVDAPRGLILDRSGIVLVDNRPTYSISVIPYEFLRSKGTSRLLALILNIDEKVLVKKVKKKKIGNFSPVRVKRNVDFKTVSDIEENLFDLVGVYYHIDSKRFYPSEVKAPHLFGYLGEITSDEITKFRRTGENYRRGDFVGKNGLEVKYEKFLRGEDGVKYIEVDVLGREVRELSELSGSEPKTGKDIYLTIDANIQKYLEDVMVDKKGAAVVLDPRNGDVLAFLSKPDYDPEIFSNPLTPDIWNKLVNHEQKPLYNRASQSLYPPGSTYKIVVAAAGLETDTINLTETVLCTGSYRLGRRPFACWKEEGHGEMNLLNAIQQSCNVYFYHKGLDVGLKNWTDFSHYFGFGSKIGLDFPNESAGLIPNAEYFDQKYGEGKWTRGLILNLSVGQGDLLTTPLQMAYFAMIIGNEGAAYRPHFIKRLVEPGTGKVERFQPNKITITQIQEETYKVLKEGMYLVVNGPKGTGRASWIKGFDVCGKTGTAQNPHGDSHAWFIGFAPKDNPEIALCIMLENGGGGGANAAPIAGGVLRTYLKNKEVVVAQR